MPVVLGDECVDLVDDNGNLIRTVYRVGNLVCKTCPSKYTPAWRRKFKAITAILDLPALVQVTRDGYVTRYLNGIDLWGDRPFKYTYNQTEGIKLTPSQKRQVATLFADVLSAGHKCGYYLADFTKRNIILAQDKMWLIDYGIIVDEKQAIEVYTPIWQTMLDQLGTGYKFTGDIPELINFLRQW